MKYLGIHNYDPNFPKPLYESSGSYQGIDSRISPTTDPQFLFEQGFFTGNYFDHLEYVRRFLQQTQSLNFYSINTVEQFWDIEFVESIVNGLHIKIGKVLNNSGKEVTPNDFLVWKKSGSWLLGIVTKVSDEKIWVAAQGHRTEKWEGEYSDVFYIDMNSWNVLIEDGECLGWLRVLGEQVEVGYLAERKSFNANLLDGMFNLEDPFELAFSKDPFCFGEYRPIQNYFELSGYFFNKLQTVSSELHHMVMIATKKAIESDELLRKFHIDEVFWPAIRHSWGIGSPFNIGRFDLVFNNHQVKMLEYNADSAGMIAETSIVQNLWAKTTGCAVGEDPGIILHTRLIEALQKIAKNKQVHIFIDYSEDEELYMEKYYSRTLKEAGIRYKENNIASQMKIIDGKVVDKDGEVVEIAWKLWNWNTILKDFYKERVNNETKLSDIMLNQHVTVLEPIWKLISSNKAILPILWELFPRHPYLLKSHFELGTNFDGSTYVEKPISGRLGENVTIKNLDQVIEGKQGHYESNTSIYQEYFDLPKFDTFHAIIGAWVIGEAGSSLIIREHESLITGYYSPMITSRIVNH
jgi:glutathionylspermidine amidase/synthetase